MSNDLDSLEIWMIDHFENDLESRTAVKIRFALRQPFFRSLFCWPRSFQTPTDPVRVRLISQRAAGPSPAISLNIPHAQRC